MAYKAMAWEARFFELYRASGNVTLSAAGAGIDRSQVYKRRDRNVEFAQLLQDARDEAIERLEAEAWRRAKTSSDTLMIFLLKALRPTMYREKSEQEHTGEVVITVRRERSNSDT